MFIVYMLFGAFLVLVGGFLAIWYQAKKVRQIHREEIIAHKQIESNTQGFNHITELISLMRENTPEQVLKWLGEKEKWFLNARLFLPPNFAQHWLSISEYCQRLVKLNAKLKEMTDELRKGGIIDEMRECESFCTKLGQRALDEIYQDMNIATIATEATQDQSEPQT